LGGGGVTAWYQSMVALSLGEFIGHACMLVACVSLTLVFHVLVALHHADHDYSKVVMRNLMLILWDASPEVYDWLYDYMKLDYILVC